MLKFIVYILQKLYSLVCLQVSSWKASLLNRVLDGRKSLFSDTSPQSSLTSSCSFEAVNKQLARSNYLDVILSFFFNSRLSFQFFSFTSSRTYEVNNRINYEINFT